MPIHEFKCPNGHMTEKLFVSFAKAQGVTQIPCVTCQAPSTKQSFSTPLPAHLYGTPDGYYKPSPTKRTTTKAFSGIHGNRQPQK
jgi:hypothetical protein